MFSQGHLIWIGVSGILAACILAVCLRKKPTLKKLFSICLPLGALSEFIKIFSASEIVPLIDPVITQKEGAAALEWIPAGEYTPYLAKEHLPLELCSLYLLFMLLALLLKDGKWKKRLYALMFASGTIGGVMGIALSSIAGDFTSTASFLTSVRAWQFFLYHSMITAVSIYVGFCKESGLVFSDFKKAYAGLVLLDIPTFYVNSLLSSEIYLHGRVAGVTHRINFFSSYVNPLGLVLTEKWQWIAYLAVRAAAAAALVILLYSLLAVKKGREDNG
ncbi:MAG: YwaF family protein [Clostridia bacterium]|nr:YwaF family protein [Clostridia bacterium]